MTYLEAKLEYERRVSLWSINPTTANAEAMKAARTRFQEILTPVKGDPVLSFIDAVERDAMESQARNGGTLHQHLAHSFDMLATKYKGNAK